MRRHTGAMGAYAACLLAAAGGCNAIAGIQDGVLGPGDDASSDGTVPGDDVSTGDVAAGDSAQGSDADAARADGDTGSTDSSSLLDVSGLDTGVPDGCAVQQPDLQHGVFVTQGGAATSCGSTTTPCGSISNAITLAAQAGKTIVYVAQGTYTETLTLQAGVDIRGGWTDLGGNWQPICTGTPASTTIIQAPPGNTRTVIASTSGAVSMDTLTIESEAPSSVGNGASVYGVFATGATTQLVLSDVIVATAAAGAGTGGAAGGPGTAGGAAGTCTTPDTGAPGADGLAGPAVGGGSYSASGYTPGATASSGGPGATGHAGTAAPTAGNPGGPTCVTITDNCYDDGSGNGCSTSGQVTSCGTVGGVGCPGTGSGGGTGGSGGGSSIGVYSFGAQVTINGGALSPGAGGAGGNGGAGGAPGAGAAGASGAIGPKLATACHNKTVGVPPNITVVCISTLFTNGAAGSGSTGGNGGTGGAGGGGSGGDSYCYYASDPTKVTSSAQCTPGAAGPGGNAGQLNHGTSGASAAHN
ncbi:MAG TPA: hypothetical protein VIF15_09540 [Polyangiaceae bacterium]